jgi:hypothetical protein
MNSIRLTLFGLIVITHAFGQEVHLPAKWQKPSSFSIKPFSEFTSKPAAKAIPENYYTKGLGFFCRQELKMQQIHVPVTFRLGSMEYVNKLEQKPGY